MTTPIAAGRLDRRVMPLTRIDSIRVGDYTYHFPYPLWLKDDEDLQVTIVRGNLDTYKAVKKRHNA